MAGVWVWAPLREENAAAPSVSWRARAGAALFQEELEEQSWTPLRTGPRRVLGLSSSGESAVARQGYREMTGFVAGKVSPVVLMQNRNKKKGR